jgi:hypothetical protein
MSVKGAAGLTVHEHFSYLDEILPDRRDLEEEGLRTNPGIFEEGEPP